MIVSSVVGSRVPDTRMTPPRPLRIAILGTRGVPPRYGGFETFVSELGQRLSLRGHAVTIYSSRQHGAGVGEIWQGIRRVEVGAIRHKYLETVSRTFLSSIDALQQSFDVALICNAANAFVLPLFRAARIPVAMNVDGIERKRRKWNVLGRATYLAGEAFSAGFADRVVADAQVIADYYEKSLAVRSVVIPYGSEFPVAEADSDILGTLGVSASQYILYVSRFEPENNPLAVVEAYARVATSLPLVMVGDAPYSRELIDELKQKADDRVILPGAIYGNDYRTLQRNALFYVQATEVGGTHPALIEAMGSGGAVLANGTPENREVGGDAVGYFEVEDRESLATAMRNWLAAESLDEWRRKARSRAKELYSWDAVTDAYERLFLELAEGA
ncbi:MAG TPA: glycosyltransferase [Thermoanaerobaculia bacterium]|nr:glycosyltransferase [Thermoanaerobaculia bacterium]